MFSVIILKKTIKRLRDEYSDEIEFQSLMNTWLFKNKCDIFLRRIIALQHLRDNVWATSRPHTIPTNFHNYPIHSTWKLICYHKIETGWLHEPEKQSLDQVSEYQILKQAVHLLLSETNARFIHKCADRKASNGNLNSLSSSGEYVSKSQNRLQC